MTEAGVTPHLQLQLTQFFNSCKMQKLKAWEIQKKCLPIYWQVLKLQFGTSLQNIFKVLSIALLVTFVPFINWMFYGFVRIILIEVLPFCDWTKLYNRNCLLGSTEVTEETTIYKETSLDCSICENFGANIKVINNANYE